MKVMLLEGLSFLKIDTDCRSYIYDPACSRIIGHTPERELILEHFMESKESILEMGKQLNCSLNELEADYRLIEAMCSEGCFQREHPVKNTIFNSSEDIMASIVESASSQLILSVTDDCNLRCEYCVFSDRYPSNKGYSSSYMEEDTAFRAVDFYFDIYKKKVAKGFVAPPSISFYGGEPLIKFNLIKKVMDYATSVHPKTEFSITTNGILMNSHVRQYFLNKNITITYSIDGYKANHDRNRKTKGGNPTFEKIMKNIFAMQSLKKRNLKSKLIAFSFCIDDYVDFNKMVEYFSKHHEILHPYTIFISDIIPYDTSYFDWTDSIMPPEEKNMRERSSKDIMESIRSKKINSSTGKKTLDLYRPFVFSDWLFNQRDISGYQAPLNRSCLPGDKMCIYPNGEIAVCEKMNQKHCIGNIIDGLDFTKIAELENRMIQLFNWKCRKCVFRQMCDVCFMYLDEDNKIPKDFCQNTFDNKCKQIKSYLKSIESNMDFDEVERIVRMEK